MARGVSFTLDRAMIESGRRPAWELLIYDVRSTSDDIGDVVVARFDGSRTLDPDTGPRDFTSDCITIALKETAADYVSAGISASSIEFSISDPHDQFDPFSVLADPTGDGRWLREHNVVVLRVGDARVSSSDWVTVFTGEIIGQAGRRFNRSTGAKADLSCKAVGREAKFLKFNRTSQSYGLGTTFLSMANDIAQNEMGLAGKEINFSGFGTGSSTGHSATYFVDEPPIVMLARIMFVDGVMPKFQSDGRLGIVDAVITGNSARAYTAYDAGIIRSIDRPFSDVDLPNCVEVVGLDADKTRIDQPLQTLAKVSVTTGYFASGEEIEVFWRDDKTLIADGMVFKVIKGINGGLSILGGDEEVVYIDASEGPGTVGAVITIDTGFAGWIIVFLAVVYVVLAAIPDAVLAFGGGFTVSIGRIIQALALGAALYLMTKIGRGDYEFLGEPLEFVFKELRARACVDGASVFELNVVEIENHLVNTQTDANNIARDILLRLRAAANPRSVSMLHDVVLEADDIFELADEGQRRFMVLSSSVSYTKGQAPLAKLGAIEVTEGVVP